MSAENKRNDYAVHIVISLLSVGIIGLLIGYNSLKTENLELLQEIEHMEKCNEDQLREMIWVDASECEKLTKRVKKLEDVVFKIKR